MEMKNIKIGVIADDFTGAGDAASFLEKSGAETIMYNAVPNELQVCDAAVISESLLISCWNIWHSPLQFYAPPYQ